MRQLGVARICPEWERAKGWLTAHGTALDRYGGGVSGKRVLACFDPYGPTFDVRYAADSGAKADIA